MLKFVSKTYIFQDPFKSKDKYPILKVKLNVVLYEEKIFYSIFWLPIMAGDGFELNHTVIDLCNITSQKNKVTCRDGTIHFNLRHNSVPFASSVVTGKLDVVGLTP